jgi:hypothetical protein
MNSLTVMMMISTITADLIVSYINGMAIEEETVEVANMLLDNGIDLEFIRVIAGGNLDNLREVTNLAYEEMTIMSIGRAYNDDSNDGKRTLAKILLRDDIIRLNNYTSGNLQHTRCN